jgi:hypothetical protein
VTIAYDQPDVGVFANIVFGKVQGNGDLFMWVIASQFMNGMLMMQRWGSHIEPCNN